MNSVEEKHKKPGIRSLKQRIDVWVTKDEKDELTDKARQAGSSLSSYMKFAGLRKSVRARTDLTAINDLVRVSGDLGRVAGLLKLWLLEKHGQGARPADVEAMMNDFRVLQNEIRSIIQQVRK
ncbi:conjugal transfer transcriptional regulator TraJ [Bartonella australis AUST/NH1]|uniref:Conjugal transfer transcriptional regulator TraJ n=1 Tax=Bartonella australis (strain Aust/NH1) TaxID=1094489 RepID=M1NWS9_BARAA|nr:conjugal transfer transcriptional regulator TraJ [Bartonella australis]AGF73942.1 conjugal transfer transcriptional regulator TraJ [Bartonella australis AUST/NH1]